LEVASTEGEGTTFTIYWTQATLDQPAA